MRWTTRSEYVSSSFVPKTTSSTTPTAAATSAVTSAQPKLSTVIDSGLISDASTSIAASTRSTTKKPSSAMNGIRSAATIGGTIAFRTAIRSDATTAPPEPVDRDARDEVRGDEQRRRGDQPREQEPEGAETRPLRLPGGLSPCGACPTSRPDGNKRRGRG